jgi:hypothetical protein
LQKCSRWKNTQKIEKKMYHKIKFASDLPMQLTVGDSK